MQSKILQFKSLVRMMVSLNFSELYHEIDWARRYR